MSIVVFLGPSLPLQEARKILPSATFRGPAEQSDIVTAVEAYGARAIGLIDGTFRQNLSVWHSEVCYALSRGVRVYGSSSMGALRAAETARYGTIGVGRVFEWYSDGTITRDDEVALAHGDQESGYVKMSEPLVNVRASLIEAVLRRELDKTALIAAVDAAASLFFPERTIPAILQRCSENGLSREVVLAVQRALTVRYVDVKRDDARALLAQVKADMEGDASPRPVTPQWNFSHPYVFETLYNHDRRIVRDGNEVSLQLVAEHLALHSTNFDEIRRAALNHALVVFLGGLLQVTATAEEIALERSNLLEVHDMDDEAVQKWLKDNDLNESDFSQFLREAAVCRRLHRWILSNRGLDRGTRYFLDELRRRGHYTEWASRAAAESSCAAAYSEEPEYELLRTKDPDELAKEHANATAVRITGDVRIWAADAGFDGPEGLREGLERAAICRDVRARVARLLSMLETMTFNENTEPFPSSLCLPGPQCWMALASWPAATASPMPTSAAVPSTTSQHGGSPSG
jgi:hypothetical protein